MGFFKSIGHATKAVGKWAMKHPETIFQATETGFGCMTSKNQKTDGRE